MKKIRVAVMALLMIGVIGGVSNPVSATSRLITTCPRHGVTLHREDASGICNKASICHAALAYRYYCPAGDYSYKVCSAGHVQ